MVSTHGSHFRPDLMPGMATLGEDETLILDDTSITTIAVFLDLVTHRHLNVRDEELIRRGFTCLQLID